MAAGRDMPTSPSLPFREDPVTEERGNKVVGLLNDGM